VKYRCERYCERREAKQLHENKDRRRGILSGYGYYLSKVYVRSGKEMARKISVHSGQVEMVITVHSKCKVRTIIVLLQS